MNDNDFVTPCGTFRVSFLAHEKAPSQMVFNASAYHAPTNTLLASFGDDTDVQADSDGPGRLVLVLRTWPVGDSFTRLVYDAGDATLTTGDDRESRTVINEALRAIHSRSSRGRTRDERERA